jgi:hypothetical protein
MLVVVFMVAGTGLAEAARKAPAERSSRREVEAAVNLAVYPPAAVAAVEKARETVAMLMAKLPAGPSRKGPGH